MKTKLIVLLPFLLLGGVVWGQVDIDTKNNAININLSQKVDSIEVPVNKGKYSLIITGKYNSISIRKDAKLYPKLSVDSSTSIKSIRNFEFTELHFKSNTVYTIATRINDEPKPRKYILYSQSVWSWTTSFGAHALFFTSRTKFISQKDANGNFAVAQTQDSKQMELMPTIMFTFINNHNNVSPGFTGGLGINFEEIAVFAGGSLGFGQNIILTAGVGVHRQNRPNSAYFIGQIIDSSITNDNLNESQYRVNPFIGISYRLDKNPFAKK